jgi:glutathione S-transferase
MHSQPALTLHALPPSHPCMTVQKALDVKGLPYERVDLEMGTGDHPEKMAELYGEGRTTVPGLMVGDEPVHGSVAILERLEQMAPEPSLYPEPIAERVHDAERWGDEELQDLGRRLPWGALHFRPEAMGSMAGATLDPAGVDYAIRFARASWRYHKITAVRLAEDLAGLPDKLDHIDALAEDAVVGGEQPTAADLQIGATMRVLLGLGDLSALTAGRPCEEIALRWFPDYPLSVPAGAYPEGWVPARG